jgi:hypothetical protein
MSQVDFVVGGFLVIEELRSLNCVQPYIHFGLSELEYEQTRSGTEMTSLSIVYERLCTRKTSLRYRIR